MNKELWKDLKSDYEEGKDFEYEGKKLFDMLLADAILDLNERLSKIEKNILKLKVDRRNDEK